MNEWINIITALLGGTTLASIGSTWFYRRENKKLKTAEIDYKNAEVSKEEAVAMQEDASAAKKMLEVVVEMQSVLMGFNETLKITLSDRDKTIAEKDSRIDELERQVREMSYTITVQDRRIKGMQKVIESNLNAIKESGILIPENKWKEFKQYLGDVDNN